MLEIINERSIAMCSFWLFFRAGSSLQEFHISQIENYDALLIPKTHGFSVETLHRDQSILYLFNNLSDL